jgi:hypothetical protein
MSTHEFAIGIILFAQIALSGCDTVDRVRSRFGASTTDTVVTATGSGLALGLQVPPALRPGDEGLLRLSLNNQTDSAVSHVRLELHVPGWAEPVPPRAGERPVTMAALESGSTVFSYRMDDTPLKPGQIETVDQRIRVPVSGISRGNASFTRTVRARLLATDGRVLAEVQTDIAADSAAIAAATSNAEVGPPQRHERIGPVELGMTAAAVKQAAPNAKDTTWAERGARQRGILVPIANRNALAVLSGDAVARIEAAHPAIQTDARLGVGSQMSELRAAYGSACADVIDGRVVVWFAGAPGAAFALDTPVPRGGAQLDASRIPATAQVTRWWVSRDVETCATGG